MASTRWTQGKLSNTIEKYMDSVAEKMSAHKGNVADRMNDQLTGMENMAKRLGVQCDCFYTKWIDKPRTVCRCRPMTPAERRKNLNK